MNGAVVTAPPVAKRRSATKARMGVHSKPLAGAALLPIFQPPTAALVQLQSQPSIHPPAPIAPAAFLESEQQVMQQRLQSLRLAMAEERTRRETSMLELQRTPVPALSGSEYRRQMQARLETKKQLMKAKKESLLSVINSVNHSNTTSNYVPPVSIGAARAGRGQDEDGEEDGANSKEWSAFEAVSERWLNVNEEKSGSVRNDHRAPSATPDTASALPKDWWESLKQAQPAPPSVLALAVSPSPGTSAESSSLLDGEAFDERAPSLALHASRMVWLQSIDHPPSATPPAINTVRKDNEATTTASTHPVIIHPSRPSTAATGVSSGSSLLDGPGFDEAASANAFAEARREWLESLNPPAPTNSTIPQSSSLGESTSAKVSCYQCYRLVPLQSSLLSSTSTASSKDAKRVCSEQCRLLFDRSQRIRLEKQRVAVNLDQEIAALTEKQRQLQSQIAETQNTRPTIESDDNQSDGSAADTRAAAEQLQCVMEGQIVESVEVSTSENGSESERETKRVSQAQSRAVSRPVTAHTVTVSVAQPKPRIEFPDDE